MLPAWTRNSGGLHRRSKFEVYADTQTRSPRELPFRRHGNLYEITPNSFTHSGWEVKSDARSKSIPLCPSAAIKDENRLETIVLLVNCHRMTGSAGVPDLSPPAAHGEIEARCLRYGTAQSPGWPRSTCCKRPAPLRNQPSPPGLTGLTGWPRVAERDPALTLCNSGSFKPGDDGRRYSLFAVSPFASSALATVSIASRIICARSDLR
jgi:hypothetical protein